MFSCKSTEGKEPSDCKYLGKASPEVSNLCTACVKGHIGAHRIEQQDRLNSALPGLLG